MANSNPSHCVFILCLPQTEDRGNGVSGEDAPFIYSFDGGSESYVMLTDELSFLPSQGFTITGWVQQEQGSEG